MNTCKVTKIFDETIYFDNGNYLKSEHQDDCCETHYLGMRDLKLEDFDNLEFDLEGDFFKRIPYYGIELVPVNGWSVKIPGYGFNNGYYSSNLDLYIYDKDGNVKRSFDISECQDISDC